MPELRLAWYVVPRSKSFPCWFVILNRAQTRFFTYGRADDTRNGLADDPWLVIIRRVVLQTKIRPRKTRSFVTSWLFFEVSIFVLTRKNGFLVKLLINPSCQAMLMGTVRVHRDWWRPNCLSSDCCCGYFHLLHKSSSNDKSLFLGPLPFLFSLSSNWKGPLISFSKEKFPGQEHEDDTILLVASKSKNSS